MRAKRSVTFAKQNGNCPAGLIRNCEVQVPIKVEFRDNNGCWPRTCCGIFARGGVNFSGKGVVWILQEDKNRIVILVRYHKIGTPVAVEVGGRNRRRLDPD